MVVMMMTMMACLQQLLLLLLLLAHLIAADCPSPSDQLEVYLVHVRDGTHLEKTDNTNTDLAAARAEWHASLVAAATSATTDTATSAPRSPRQQRILYSYTAAFQGFSALLTPAEAAFLGASDEVTALERDTPARVHTTRTPAFLGLVDTNNEYKGGSNVISPNYSSPSFSSSSSMSDRSNLWAASSRGRNAIIAILDTGIWPEHPSFSDAGFSPPDDNRSTPWNGSCEPSIPCNRKLIGARSFYKGFEAANCGRSVNETLDFKSPRDSNGHGTHTASTAAGSPVVNSSFLGFGTGTASGVAPLARISVYKVCWENGEGCYYSDILAAFDAAISDGVDVISLSLGGDNDLDYSQDVIAIGAFAAISRGIVVTSSAGNGGPVVGSVTNGAPWIFTVAASTIDRDFSAPVVLGNGKIYEGASLYVGNKSIGPAELIHARESAVTGGDVAVNASFCGSASLLNSTLVEGKIVVCERGGGVNRVLKGLVVKQAGGIGMIIGNGVLYREELTAQAHLVPATQVGFSAMEEIQRYTSTTFGGEAAASESPTASIYFNGTRVGYTRAPVMAAFSARGPNPLSLDVLKPDFTAPGVNILAAWTAASSATGIDEDKRGVLFNIISGTSMSCPHVAGLAALLRSAHPTWSPAAIKSALMTTAKVEDDTGRPITDSAAGGADATPLGFGAGHVNPNAALDPGLIYDIDPQDYLNFLCALNYNESMIATFSSVFVCNHSHPRLGDLNYPSISAVFPQHGNVGSEMSAYSSTFIRTVTNVGLPNSTYTVNVVPPPLVNVSVSPSTICFNSTYQKLSYSITFAAPYLASLPQGFAFSFGSLHWHDDQHHIVRSPISFIWYDASTNTSTRTTQH